MKRTYNTNIQIGESLTILLDESDLKQWKATHYISGTDKPESYPVLVTAITAGDTAEYPQFITLKEAQKITDTIRSAYCAMESESLKNNLK